MENDELRPETSSFQELATRDAVAVDETAREFVYQLSLLFKLAAVHESTNDALIKPVREMADIVRRLLKYDPNWFLKVLHEHLFINESRIRLTMDISTHYLRLVEDLKKKGIGLISMGRVPSEKEVTRFIYILLPHTEVQGVVSLREKLGRAGLEFIGVEELPEEEIYTAEMSRGRVRQMARETFFRSIFMTGGIMKAVDQKRVINTRRARRVIQSFLELLDMDENYFMGLTTIKNYDEYTLNHSVNVTILALNMGRRLGFSRTQLTELGLSAIFHDLGKTSVPQEITNKTQALNDDEWRTMHLHPVEGVKKLLRLKGVTELTVKLVLSVYEHHINYDFTGYPEATASKEANLFSRILRIVDSYDAMTTRRSYAKIPKHPVAALEEIWNLAGQTFDPGLVKVFIGLIGMYPVGAIVQVSTGASGMVTEIRGDLPPGHQEVINVLSDWEGFSSSGELIDLSMNRDRYIVGYYDFGTVPFDPAWYLLNLEEKASHGS